jgi:hypothetical protein
MRSVPVLLAMMIGGGLGGCGSAPATPQDASVGDTTLARPDATPGPATFAFVVVGCNRLQKADAGGVPTTANLAQLQRTFTDIAALSPRPDYLFLTGDIVLGLTDEVALRSQLVAWRAMYEAGPLPALGIQLVVLPGNHEAESKATGTEIPYAAAETTFVDVMAPYIAGSNGPGVGGPDALPTDQRRLTYSFDHKGTHFVIVDTDPVGGDSTAPVQWIAADLAAAHAAGAAHLFVLGHKPAYPSPLTPTSGLVAASRDGLWAALEANHGEAMLAAHNHLWFKTRPQHAWQIVAGNGGSQLEKNTTGADAYYGFTVVDVTPAAVTATSYGRDVPSAGYLAPAPAATYPTTIRDTVDLTWR